ncbi:hypothetical protein Poly21_14360 [Allorhodopirellula heiligendammensis]|uniref:Uncharacterized protein n=1 Tax=Allorhodopirellula heiligendammensis TaxID=2714739 RepID=A0A5C6C7H3_9BACT|nr:hypothetical protein Poly21_14360 [Allorhodopirellula heiligendammensis]
MKLSACSVFQSRSQQVPKAAQMAKNSVLSTDNLAEPLCQSSVMDGIEGGCGSRALNIRV